MILLKIKTDNMAFKMKGFSGLRSPMKKEGNVAKGKQQVYKKEIKQLENKLNKLFPNYDQNEAEITKT